MLEGGGYISVTELAIVEKINPSYLCRTLRLTLLAPSIVETILNGQQDDTSMLMLLSKPFPTDWNQQGKLIEPVSDQIDRKANA
jgi:hypothetical protein